jgi:hypothetical protein
MVYALINDGKVGGKATVGLEPTNGDDYMLIEVEDPTTDGGLYMNHGRALVSGRRVKLEHVPKQMRQDGPAVIPDYGRSHGLIYMTDKFKAVVEAVEPGVHQFIPFEIVGPKKVVIAKMWFMVVCTRLDSVDREHTTLILDHGVIWASHRDVPREDWPENFDSSKPNRLVFNFAQIGDRHLWYDKHDGGATSTCI